MGEGLLQDRLELLVITITTNCARFCAPLLCIKMSLMYFFLIVVLNR